MSGMQGGATREIGSCLTRIVIRHKAMESRMKTLCSALLDCMVLPLQDQLDDWRKTVATLDKDHCKEYKKLRAEIKKRSEVVSRLQKKNSSSSSSSSNSNKKAGSSNSKKSSAALNAANAELNRQYRMLLETERTAVRKALTEERARYCSFVTCLRPMLEEEVSMVAELQQLEEVSKRLARNTEEPYKLPAASEQVLNDLASHSGDSHFTFQTPPSSPSSLGSRKSSMCSISSAGSSSNGSNSVQHSPNKQGILAGNSNINNNAMMSMSTTNAAVSNAVVAGGATIRHRSMSQLATENPEDMLSIETTHHSNSGNPMMRLSSISSQDSGFTSQDTLFLRPNSPSRMKNAGNMMMLQDSGSNERPHTISTAYEKGGLHQRPPLQPYTFQQPETTTTIEQQQPLFKKPPVPQRCMSLDGSGVLPAKPALPKAGKPTLLLQKGGKGLPNFNASRDDMVLPQPVYMNMSDLAAMAAQKAQQQNSFQYQQQQQQQSQYQQQQQYQQFNQHPTIEEEAPDLKTPTAEDLNMPGGPKPPGIPSGDGSSSTSESSLGSSSGYGSQSTVRLEEQQQQQQQHQQQQHNQTLTEGEMPRPIAAMPDPMTKYRSLPRHQNHNQQTNFNQHNTFATTNTKKSTTNSNQSHYSESPVYHHHHQQQQRVLNHRPYSFTQGVIPEICELDLGTTNLCHTSTLRRSHSNALPPTNHHNNKQQTPPPPPPPQQQQHNQTMSSNSSTPRGSMEHLPPPPPHLLLSDSEDDNVLLRNQQHIHTQRGVSVAESIRALQQSGHMPCSPKSLRRAHSISGSTGSCHVSGSTGSCHEEQIYAPVAQLQQKLQQRQMMMSTKNNVKSPEGETYGFGQQFRQHQSQFYQQQVHVEHPQQFYQQQQHQQQPQAVMQQQQSQQHMGIHQQPHVVVHNVVDQQQQQQQFYLQQQQLLQQQQMIQQQQQQQQMVQQHQHDQIMRDVDANMRNRPPPPPLVGNKQVTSSNYDAQTAMRVRRWIESKSVTDVRDCRPYLNQEIHQGFSLRKSGGGNDRSAPTF